MNEAVSDLLVQRQALDRGLPRAVVLSAAGHALLLLLAVGAPLLLPRGPQLDVQAGFVVPLPPGGRGAPNVEPAPAVSAPPQPEPPAPEPPKPQPPPKVIKPPKEPPRKGLPPLDAKKGRAKPEKTPPPPARAGGAPGGTGTSTQPYGLEFGPLGPGVPGGTDMMGDWYLAGVQRKIWMIWAQQIRAGQSQPVAVVFTIEADGSATDVRVVQSSGVYLIDSAAQRAVLSASPFGPLPKNYGINRVTIQANFKPTS